MLAEIALAIVLFVVDGDTVKVKVPAWAPPFSQWSIRIRDLDTPELKGKCPEEKAAALRAKYALKKLIPPGAIITLRHIAFGKYSGRLVADVLSPEYVDVAADFHRRGLGRRYDGKSKRQGWCPTP